MSADLDLHGVYVPLITPFTASGEVALGEIETLCGEYLDSGATGIVALGTTGEPATLSADEKASVISVIAAVCRARGAQLIIGAGTNSTSVAVDMVREASTVDGVSALLSVVPYYTRPSEAGVVEHFKVLAAESRVPLIVYNIPYRTGRGLGAASLLELAHTANIAGVKQSVGGVDADTLTLMANKPSEFAVLCGDDPFLYPLLTLGGVGGIAASAHVCTESFVEMVSSANKGDYETARKIAEKLLPVCTALFAEPSPSVLKGVLAKQGRISSAGLRLPMTHASDASVDVAYKAMQTAG